MATDVAPELLEQVRRKFEERTLNYGIFERLANKIRDGTATLRDAQLYAQQLGANLSIALKSVLTEDSLPDGKLYWNIANRIITPMLESNYRLTNDMAIQILSIIDRTQGVGLAPVKAALPVKRIRGVVDKAVSAETHEDMKTWLGEPVVNCTQSFIDDFVQANAEARYRAGMSPKIVRTASPGCCSWCADLAGTYDYADVRSGSDVYRRHEACRCVVTFESGRERQNVWSKRIWEDDENVLEMRRIYGIEIDRR